MKIAFILVASCLAAFAAANSADRERDTVLSISSSLQHGFLRMRGAPNAASADAVAVEKEEEEEGDGTSKNNRLRQGVDVASLAPLDDVPLEADPQNPKNDPDPKGTNHVRQGVDAVDAAPVDADLPKINLRDHDPNFTSENLRLPARNATMPHVAGDLPEVGGGSRQGALIYRRTDVVLINQYSPHTYLDTACWEWRQQNRILNVETQPNDRNANGSSRWNIKRTYGSGWALTCGARVHLVNQYNGQEWYLARILTGREVGRIAAVNSQTVFTATGQVVSGYDIYWKVECHPHKYNVYSGDNVAFKLEDVVGNYYLDATNRGSCNYSPYAGHNVRTASSWNRSGNAGHAANSGLWQVVAR